MPVVAAMRAPPRHPSIQKIRVRVWDREREKEEEIKSETLSGNKKDEVRVRERAAAAEIVEFKNQVKKYKHVSFLDTGWR